jgi:hypothetical protein
MYSIDELDKAETLHEVVGSADYLDNEDIGLKKTYLRNNILDVNNLFSKGELESNKTVIIIKLGENNYFVF